MYVVAHTRDYLVGVASGNGSNSSTFWAIFYLHSFPINVESDL